MGNIRFFATLRISVKDVRKSTQWYKKLFDREPIEQTSKFASFKIKDTCFDIVLADRKSPISKGGSVGYWLVDDLNEFLLKVEKLKGIIYRGPLEVPEIKRVIAQIQDPFGNIMGFEGPLKRD